MNTPLHIAFSLTDRTRPLLEKRVVLPGFDLQFTVAEPVDIFWQALREKNFDVCEMSMGSHLMATARDEADYVAVPVFLSRAFRHNAIYVRTDRGIASPSDLAHRSIGTSEYQQTAGLWVRGMLEDEYGLDLSKVLWRTGGLEKPGVGERIPIARTAKRNIVPIKDGETLSKLLESGGIDAIISPRPPSCFGVPGVPVKRLFENSLEAEKEYFAKTGFFPLMHCLAVRKDVAERFPDLPPLLVNVFTEAKKMALKDLTLTNYYRVSLPWVSNHYAEVAAIMGPDPWRFGFAPCLPEIGAMIRYAYNDGLIDRMIEPERLFHPNTVQAL